MGCDGDGERFAVHGSGSGASHSWGVEHGLVEGHKCNQLAVGFRGGKAGCHSSLRGGCSGCRACSTAGENGGSCRRLVGFVTALVSGGPCCTSCWRLRSVGAAVDRQCQCIGACGAWSRHVHTGREGPAGDGSIAVAVSELLSGNFARELSFTIESDS